MAVSSTGASAAGVTPQYLLDEVNPAKKTTSSTAVDAQSRFLTLLTAQLKNQDPLNPLDNAQMTSQLAQINTVDGIEKLNATLQKMMANSNDATAMQASALLGRQVMVAGNTIDLYDIDATEGVALQAMAGVELKSRADRVTVNIVDKSGSTVRTLELDKKDREAGLHNFAWDGKNNLGETVAPGEYKFAIKATVGEEDVKATSLALAGVASVNRSSQGVTLDLGKAGLVTMNDIKQIY